MRNIGRTLGVGFILLASVLLITPFMILIIEAVGFADSFEQSVLGKMIARL